MPHRRDYKTIEQFGQAVVEYARSKDNIGQLHVTAVYPDGSVYTDTVPREVREVSFKWYDEETVEGYYDTHKFVDPVFSDYIPVTIGKMKKAIIAWLEDKEYKPVSITFMVY